MTKRNAYMTDELEAIYDQTVEFVTKEVQPHGDAWEEAGHVPREVLEKMGSLGMFGLRIPEAFGGLGLGPLASATFSEALGASTYGGFEATVLVHTDMASPHLVHSGNEEQLGRFIPGVSSGEIITAIAVTEPDAGSDVAAMRTNAVRDGDGLRLNGTKMFITNGARRHGDRRCRDRLRGTVRRSRCSSWRRTPPASRWPGPSTRWAGGALDTAELILDDVLGARRRTCWERSTGASTRSWRTSRTSGWSSLAWPSARRRRRSS